MQTTRGAPHVPYIKRMRGDPPKDRIQRPLAPPIPSTAALLKLIDFHGLDVSIARTMREYLVSTTPSEANQEWGFILPRAVYQCDDLAAALNQAASDYDRLVIDSTAATLTKKRSVRCLM